MISRKLLTPLANPIEDTTVSLISHNHTTYNGALPTHAIGDYIFGIAQEFDSSGAPTVPSGWTTVMRWGSSIGENNWSRSVAYKVAASASESAAWGVDADFVSYIVLRGASGVGASNVTITRNLLTLPTPAPSLSEQNGSSFIVMVAAASATSQTVTINSGFYTKYTSSEVNGNTATLFTRAGRVAVLPAPTVTHSPGGGLGQAVLVEVLS